MYTYIISTRTYISKKHANNEDYSDEEREQIDMTDHITNICFVASSIENALEKAKIYNFHSKVDWCKDTTENSILDKFTTIRKLTPKYPNMVITEEIGYILENPKVVREFITISEILSI